MQVIMNVLVALYDSIVSIISRLTGEQIALVSVFVTFIIYASGKRNELKMKRHEAKKEQYMKLMKFFQKLYDYTKDETKDVINAIDQKEFFDLGSSLLLYGSKKLYRQYLFYREFSSNPLVEQSKYYSERLSLYLLADMFRTIRREVGLNGFSNITKVEALGFFVNNVSFLPKFRIESYKAQCDITMIGIELFLFDRIYFITSNYIFYLLFAPIIRIFEIMLKYFVMIPLGKLILKINPNAESDLDKLQTKINEMKCEVK